ncbi:MAG: Ni/Fe-hydrogenase, b-type cytochrome subunit [Candidatus Aminicenantes bacterium RBG_13_59_9]|jgi:Ni/Fe-hydrogenase 1 B-type cytochrome subunit|nr:MAG: Ni/Fe-hydrogenase, b-type cytochrome subunit [Candidatus Aminicenantes bacterium RBG_13_59_9]
MSKTPPAEYFQVYVWDLPMRFHHWLNALCVFGLGVTGFFIGRPVSIASSADASSQYLFGWLRFAHFVFAYVFFFNFLGRLYWGFAGNSFARWKSYPPRTPAKWREVFQVLCIDIFLICKLPIQSMGINALAGIIYSFMYLAIVFQIFTGFALYSVLSPGWFPRLFAWVIPLFGGVQAVRQWHHLFTWIFVAFTMMHIYLSWYHDYLEGRGTISSMIGGWKFIEKTTR